MGSASVIAGSAPVGGLPVRLGVFGDERLARLVGAGNERAFAVIYDRYHQRLYRYCRSVLREDADAQDALQSTFAGAFVALRRAQRDAPLRPWLFRIAHNEAVSLIRRRGVVGELGEVSEQWVSSAEDRAGERERLALLVADLQALPDRQRGALVMRELSGLSHEEIAIALGTSVGTAKQAIFEARGALLEFAEGRLMVCEDVRRRISDGDGRALRARRVRAHLRDCVVCAAFAAAIPGRRDDLQALVPVLAPAASAAMLARVLGAGSGHGTGAGAGAGAVAAGAAVKSVGASVGAKALLGVVVLVSAAAGVSGVRAVLMLTEHHARPAGVGSVAGRGVGGAGVGALALGVGARGVDGAQLGGRAVGAGSSSSAGQGSSGSRFARRSGAGVLSSQAQSTPRRSVTGGHPSASRPGVAGAAGGRTTSIAAAGYRGAAGGSRATSATGSHTATSTTGSHTATSTTGSHTATGATSSILAAPSAQGVSSVGGATSANPPPSSLPAQITTSVSLPAGSR